MALTFWQKITGIRGIDNNTAKDDVLPTASPTNEHKNDSARKRSDGAKEKTTKKIDQFRDDVFAIIDERKELSALQTTAYQDREISQTVALVLPQLLANKDQAGLTKLKKFILDYESTKTNHDVFTEQGIMDYKNNIDNASTKIKSLINKNSSPSWIVSKHDLGAKSEVAKSTDTETTPSTSNTFSR